MDLLIVAGIIVLTPFLITAFAFFNDILRYQESHHEDAWRRDGTPSLQRWSWNLTAQFRNGYAYHRVCWVWIFTTPDSAVGDPEAIPLFRRYRVAVARWNIGALAPAVEQAAVAEQFSRAVVREGQRLAAARDLADLDPPAVDEKQRAARIAGQVDDIAAARFAESTRSAMRAIASGPRSANRDTFRRYQRTRFGSGTCEL